ncbi:MAG: hypothetical protein WC831_03340 [Parcubacteria group bacterium]
MACSGPEESGSKVSEVGVVLSPKVYGECHKLPKGGKCRSAVKQTARGVKFLCPSLNCGYEFCLSKHPGAVGKRTNVRSIGRTIFGQDYHKYSLIFLTGAKELIAAAPNEEVKPLEPKRTLRNVHQGSIEPPWGRAEVARTEGFRLINEKTGPNIIQRHPER